MRLFSPIAVALPLALALAVVGCGKGDKGPGKSDPVDSGTGSGTADGLVTAGPELLSAGENVPLTRILAVSTSRPVRVEATVGDGSESKTWRFAAEGTEHGIPLIGFKPDREWTVEVVLVEPDGTRHGQESLLVAAPELPVIYPSYDVRTLDPAGVQPGYTLLNMRSSGSPPQPDETWTLLDEKLEPVWHVLLGPQAKMVFQRADGLFMGLEKTPDIQGQFAIARDLTGTTVEEFHTDESWSGVGAHLPNTFALHHDLIELPSGNFAALTKEPTGFAVDNFPVSYDDPLIRMDGLNVNADRIVEFDSSGAVVRNIGLGALMDTNRIGHDSLDASFLDGRLDWIHANGLAYDAGSDAFLVSFRHQDAVIKVDRQSGGLIWILGTHANWSPSHQPFLLTAGPGLEWAYHQHSPNISADGTRLIVFDNGNWRSSPWDGTPDPDDGPLEMRSRIVEFGIDEGSWTVEQNWEFMPPDGFHSCPAVGGASYLDNGNVLATFGLVVAVNGTLTSDLGFGSEAIRIVEFAPGEPHTVVGDVWISAPQAALAEGWQAFSAHRIASPYPPGFVLE